MLMGRLADGQTNMAKLTVVFRNFANTPKIFATCRTAHVAGFLVFVFIFNDRSECGKNATPCCAVNVFALTCKIKLIFTESANVSCAVATRDCFLRYGGASYFTAVKKLYSLLSLPGIL
jgi:hypothetical protein